MPEDKSPNRTERRIALFGPPRDPDGKGGKIITTSYWNPPDGPFFRKPIVRVVAITIPFVIAVPWFLSNFLQTRGVVNVRLSRSFLYAAAVLIVVNLLCIAYNLPKWRIRVALVSLVVTTGVAGFVDWETVPKAVRQATYMAVSLPGISAHAVLKIYVLPKNERQEIFALEDPGGAKFELFLSPSGLLTLLLTDVHGDTYDVESDLSEVPADKFLYLVCTAGIDHQTTKMSMAVNGKEVGHKEIPVALDLGKGWKVGMLGADGTGKHPAAFELADLMLYSASLDKKDQDLMDGYIEKKYAIAVERLR